MSSDNPQPVDEDEDAPDIRLPGLADPKTCSHEWSEPWAGWRHGLPEWWLTCKHCGKDKVMPR